MYRSICTATLAGMLFLGGTLAAGAAESTFEMQAIREKGPGPVIGTVHAAETPDGLSLRLDLTDLPPGPNRLFLHEAGDCSVPRGEPMTNALAVVNVGITEDGAQPLKQTVLVPAMTLADMSHKSLVVHRGSETADLAPEQTGQRRLVACGVAR